jgi:hypothetical protein
MRFLIFIALCGLLPSALLAGNFEMAAHVSKADVELGETITLKLAVVVDGNLAFAPQLDALLFEGFQVQSGPRQSQQVNWMNGVVKAQVSVEWELAAIKSGTLTLGPFRATAKDASQGDIVKIAPAIAIHVAKSRGAVLPPTPTPDSGGAPGSQASQDALRDIKADLGFPWGRALVLALAALALAAGFLWLFFKPKKPKKIEVIRDPGQVALLDLEKAREILARGDEEAYYLELARIIRFYLRHRLRTPDKELTLFEAELLVRRALGGTEAEKNTEAIARLQELLFGGIRPEARDADTLPLGLRQAILDLEKGASWKPSEIVKAELERARELYSQKGGEHYFSALGKAFRDYRGQLEERLGQETSQARLAKALEELGPAASARLQHVLLFKRLDDEMDLDKLYKELQRLIDALEGGNHGK